MKNIANTKPHRVLMTCQSTLMKKSSSLFWASTNLCNLRKLYPTISKAKTPQNVIASPKQDVSLSEEKLNNLIKQSRCSFLFHSHIMAATLLAFSHNQTIAFLIRKNTPSTFLACQFYSPQRHNHTAPPNSIIYQEGLRPLHDPREPLKNSHTLA